eukprot:TRINITY_DN6001_c0_g3_i4.p2 TRINITY_DN6001_c0_g3~~TRINITY_DN6001_c0_g3_i4.p2  ORF type:complete len:112 (+),score=10.02 TRINITY_DN6001_c0_g3_i4:147-482(+)
MEVVERMLRVESIGVEMAEDCGGGGGEAVVQSRESVDQAVIRLCVKERGLDKRKLGKAHALGYVVRREGEGMREIVEVVFGYEWPAVLAREVMAWQRKFRQQLNKLCNVRK